MCHCLIVCMIGCGLRCVFPKGQVNHSVMNLVSPSALDSLAHLCFLHHLQLFKTCFPSQFLAVCSVISCGRVHFQANYSKLLVVFYSCTPLLLNMFICVTASFCSATVPLCVHASPVHPWTACFDVTIAACCSCYLLSSS